jgi:Fe-S-cluster containining protein
MPFDHCAECRRCCFVEAGYPALEITLTKKEKKDLGSVCIETNCVHLGPVGCTLGERKPFSCTLYPLAYNPTRREIYYDTDCPVMAGIHSAVGMIQRVRPPCIWLSAHLN